jgi:acetyl esterase/lipase
LAELGDQVPVGVGAEGIPALRAGMAAMSPSLADVERGGTIEVRELAVPGPAGAPDISLLVCRPRRLEGAAPVVYLTHGGGMIMGDNRSGLLEILDWALELDLVVVSVEYRLAPDAPHPGPVQDCYAGLQWTVEHAEELGIDSARVVVAGHSAGGGLAAALALLARDRGGPALLGQFLACPMLDDRNETVSARQMEGRGVWDRVSNVTGWTALLGEERGGPEVSPYAAPARAADLSGLPPAFIDVGSAETFRDEAVSYASRLWAAGGVAELHVWPGGFHGYYSMAPHSRIAQETIAARVRWISRLLAL